MVQDGRRRRPHVLRLVLSHSRKGYTEAFWRQTTENFIRGIENAFRHWGGVVPILVIDNLRAAVKKVDWFEPELNPKVISFCEHYGTVILPTKPAMPRHKGKVEAGVKYVQDNGLAGKQFEGLGAQNVHLAHWEETVADTRIHGTTRQQVRTHFLTVEKPKLLPLPAGLFPVFSEAPRKVHRDGYVEVDKAYYSVPPEYVRRGVWARWDVKMVRLFNDRMEAIAVHVRQEPGKFKTDPAHSVRVVQVVDGGVVAKPGALLYFEGLRFANQLGVRQTIDTPGYMRFNVDLLIFLKVDLSHEALTAASRGKAVIILALAKENGKYKYTDTSGHEYALKAYDVGIPCASATVDGKGHPDELHGANAVEVWVN